MNNRFTPSSHRASWMNESNHSHRNMIPLNQEKKRRFKTLSRFKNFNTWGTGTVFIQNVAHWTYLLRLRPKRSEVDSSPTDLDNMIHLISWFSILSISVWYNMIVWVYRFVLCCLLLLLLLCKSDDDVIGTWMRYTMFWWSMFVFFYMIGGILYKLLFLLLCCCCCLLACCCCCTSMYVPRFFDWRSRWWMIGLNRVVVVVVQLNTTEEETSS